MLLKSCATPPASRPSASSRRASERRRLEAQLSEAPALRDVDHHHDFFVAIRHGVHRQQGVARPATGLESDLDTPNGLPARPGAEHNLAQRRVQPHLGDEVDRPAGDVGALHAEKARERLVDVLNGRRLAVDDRGQDQVGLKEPRKSRFGVAQLTLRQVPFRDVTLDTRDADDISRSVVCGRERHRDHERAAVLVPRVAAEHPHRPACHHFGRHLAEVRPVAERVNDRDRLAGDLVFAVAEHALGARIPRLNAAAQIREDDGVVRSADDRREPLARLLQLPHARDVGDHRQPRLPSIVERDAGRGDVDVDEPPVARLMHDMADVRDGARHRRRARREPVAARLGTDVVQGHRPKVVRAPSVQTRRRFVRGQNPPRARFEQQNGMRVRLEDETVGVEGKRGNIVGHLGSGPRILLHRRIR